MQLTLPRVIRKLLGERINKYVNKNIVVKSQNGPSDGILYILYLTVVLQGEGSATISIALLGHFMRAVFSSPIDLLGILRRAMFSSPRFFKRRGLHIICV